MCQAGRGIGSRAKIRRQGGKPRRIGQVTSSRHLRNSRDGLNMAVELVRLRGHELGPHKAVMSPLMNSRNVLTNSPWTFVGLGLKRNQQSQALLYWEQTEEFHKASVGLSRRSLISPR